MIVINRFVDDKELADLFQKAAVVVYPYISATQSGVISIASFFKKPIVLSDVDYFKEVAPKAKILFIGPSDMGKSINGAITTPPTWLAPSKMHSPHKCRVKESTLIYIAGNRSQKAQQLSSTN